MIVYRNHNLLVALALLLFLSSCAGRETTYPVRRDIEDAVFASGYIEQENNYLVSSYAEGIITSLPVKEGDSVAQDDLIATIDNDVQNNQLQDAKAVFNDAVINASPDSPQLVNIQTQIQQARQQLEFDRENYLRYKDLRERNSVSQLEYEKMELQFKASENNLIALEKNYKEIQNTLQLNLERSRAQLNTQESLIKDYRISAEAPGTVIHVFKKQGELVRRGEAIARIGRGAYLIKLFVSENDITKIKVGQQVAVNVNTYPGRVFHARVSKIHPGFDETEQSYIVEAQFEQLPEIMFSGTQLQANIELGLREKVLVIPTKYVYKGSFVKLESGEERRIETGSRNSEWTEVISGITDEDLILNPDD